MTNPFNIDLQRERIDDHKRAILANPWKRGAYDRLDQESCVQYWIEQIADAELYENRWYELDAAGRHSSGNSNHQHRSHEQQETIASDDPPEEEPLPEWARVMLYWYGWIDADEYCDRHTTVDKMTGKVFTTVAGRVCDSPECEGCRMHDAAERLLREAGAF